MTRHAISHSCVYDSQIPLAAQTSPLVQSLNVDVCIIGGGISGLTAAYALLQQGANVALLESHHIGWGASGRNSGQLIPGFNRDIRELATIYGEEQALAAYQATLDSLITVKEQMANTPHGCYYHEGIITAAPSETAMGSLQQYAYYVNGKMGRNVSIIDEDAIRRLVGSKAYYGGLLDEDAGHFCPRSYLKHLTELCLQSGLQLFEHTTVAAFNPHGEHVHVRTIKGSISCKHLIVATNAYGDLLPEPRRNVIRMNALMIATAPLTEEQHNSILPANNAVFEWRHLLNYYRKTPDGRLIFGAADSAADFSEKDLQQHAANTRKQLHKIFPQLRQTIVTHAWHGRLSTTLNEMPDINQAHENVYYLQGDAGHGLLPFHAAATAIAHHIGGNSKTFDLLKSMQHKPIPGAGQFDGLYVKLGRLYYGLVDALN